MTVIRRRNAATTLLRVRGADDLDHPGGTLLAHLTRVQSVLAEWGAHEEVQLAGLCHAAYGTDGFGVVLLTLDERPVLVDAIGSRAEALVYLYASCDRGQTYPTLAQPCVTFADRFRGRRYEPAASVLRAFMEITAANELDVVRHNAELGSRHGRGLAALFDRAGDHLSGPARQAWTDFATARSWIKDN